MTELNLSFNFACKFSFVSLVTLATLFENHYRVDSTNPTDFFDMAVFICSQAMNGNIKQNYKIYNVASSFSDRLINLPKLKPRLFHMFGFFS